MNYRALHAAIAADRGPAKSYTCSHCPKPAAEWAYMGGCPDELQSPQKLRYSLDLWRYLPLCKRCHVALDTPRNACGKCGRAYSQTPSGVNVCRPCRNEYKTRTGATKRPGIGQPGTRTHCPQGHEYSEENTYVAMQATGVHRQCKRCKSEQKRARKANQ